MSEIGVRDRTEPWLWLQSTKDLQETAFGYAFPIIGPAYQAPYLDWNVTAAGQELAEVREEFSWKPWATDQPFVNRDRVRDEVIDVMHFLGNILVAIGVDDAEFEEHYKAKQDRNRARMASGTYSARKGGLSEGSDA